VNGNVQNKPYEEIALTIQGPISNLLKEMNHKKNIQQTVWLKDINIFAVRVMLMIMDIYTAETNPSSKSA